MRKFICAVLIAVLAGLLFVGCADDPTPVKEYTVTFDSQGGSVVSSAVVIEGKKLKRPNAPTRDGYFFNGWYTSSLTTADTEWRFDADRVRADITLYAGWTADSEQEEITKMFITIGDNKLEVTLENNSAADALVEILKQGDIKYTARDYGNFEKVGDLGHSLPTANNVQMTTSPGDVILYSGSQMVLFYGSNSWSYTKLGRITGYTAAELRTLLGAGQGDVEVTVSLK